jgi:hypothetical protein
MPEAVDYRKLEFDDYISLRNLFWASSVTALAAFWRIARDSLPFQEKVVTGVAIYLALFIPGLINWKKAKGIISAMKN